MRILSLLALLIVAPAWAQTTQNEWRYLAARQEAQAVLAEKAEALNAASGIDRYIHRSPCPSLRTDSMPEPTYSSTSYRCRNPL